MSAKETLERIERRGYCLVIQKNEDGGLLRITVVPKSFSSKSMVNLFMVAVINTMAHFMIKHYFPLSFSKQLLAVTSTFLLLSIIFRRPTVESFIVLKNYGVQITKLKGLVFLPLRLNKCWFEKTEFIPRDQIVDVIINEGFERGFQVVFYLAVLVKESTKLKLLFAVCTHKPNFINL